MTALVIELFGALTVVLALIELTISRRLRRTAAAAQPDQARRIGFPFAPESLSVAALDYALRLAASEHATLVAVSLTRVSLHLPLDTPLPRQARAYREQLDAIQRRARAFGVTTVARIEQGRSHRHALRHAIASERYDRIVIAAASRNETGINSDDIRWLLANAPGEIIVVRPDIAKPTQAPTAMINTSTPHPAPSPPALAHR